MVERQTKRSRTLPLCASALATAVLAACGGGSGTPETQAIAGQATEKTMGVGDAGTWTHLANEWAKFTVSGTQTVRLGVGDKWVELTMSGDGVCAPWFFKQDPAVGTPKSCQVKLPDATGTASNDRACACAGSGPGPWCGLLRARRQALRPLRRGSRAARRQQDGVFQDRRGDAFPEIAKTGANVVRFMWVERAGLKGRPDLAARR